MIKNIARNVLKASRKSPLAFSSFETASRGTGLGYDLMQNSGVEGPILGGIGGGLGLRGSIMRRFGLGDHSSGLDDSKKRFTKQEVLKTRNEARRYLDQKREEMELAREEGIMTVNQITESLIHLGGLKDFQKRIMDSKKPSVVFVYASWCKVSQTLLPTILDEFAKSAKLWNMAVFDIDNDAEMTSMLEISKTPTLMLINNADVIDGLKGLPSDNELRLFFSSLSKLIDINQKEELRRSLYSKIIETQEKVKNGQKQQKNQKKAQKHSRELLDLINDLSGIGGLSGPQAEVVKLIEIQALHKTGDRRASKSKFEQYNKDYKSAQNSTQTATNEDAELISELYTAIEASFANPEAVFDEEFERLKKVYSANPNNFEACFNLADKARALEQYELACELLLYIVQMDRKWEDGIAQKELLSLFDELGSANELVKRSRRELSQILH